jgi:O-antigen ligase
MLDPSGTEGRLAFEALNPITLGHVAASTLLALLCLTSYRAPFPLRWIQVGIAVVAAICLMVAGSRGPILALGCAGFAYAVMSGRWRWVVGLSLVVAISLFRTETSLFERFATGGQDASSLERLFIQGNAILQFLGSPIYGSAYAELESLEYPHNLIIETAMALGSIGLVVLLIVLVTTAARLRREWRSRELLVPVLFVQYFIAVQLSGSIWGGTAFWVLVCILLRSSRRSVAIRDANQAPLTLRPPQVQA